MPQQSYGQRVLHTERKSPNPNVQQLKEETAEIITGLFEQEEQSTDLNEKEWLNKSIMYFKLGFDHAEKALNVQPIQMQEQAQTNGSQSGYQFTRKRQQEPA